MEIRTGCGALAFVLMGLLSGCTSDDADLCESTFQPYPDLITGRVISERHKGLLNGMEAYTKGDYAQAAELLSAYTETLAFNKASLLYLANSYLALGKPFEAELQLDRLELSPLKEHYTDQTEWYTVVCLVCSAQLDRALEAAQRIAQGRRHTYEREAKQLIEKLRNERS